MTAVTQPPARPNSTLKTSLGRALASLIAVAALSALLLALYVLVSVYVAQRDTLIPQYALTKATGAFLYALLLWLIAMVVLGGPVWVVLHLTGRRRWSYAIAAGFLVPFLTILGFGTGFFDGETSNHWSSYAEGGQQWIDGKITPFGWYIAFRLSATFGAIGAAQGLAVWYLAYYRVATEPHP